MKDDFEIIQHSFPDKKAIRIYIIADLHFGSPQHNAAEFKKLVKVILDDPDGYCVLVGDLCDTALKNSKSDVYSATMTIMDQIQAAVDQLRELAKAGKIIGHVPGNHELRAEKEANIDISYIIAEQLGIADLYRPNLAFIQIKLNDNDPTHNYHRCYYIAMTHGSGGGTTYAFLNKNSQFASLCEGVDVFITGHTHKPAVIQPARLRIDRRRQKVTTAPIYCVTAASWMDYGGYAANKMLLPAATCRPQFITLSTTGITVTT